VRFWFWDEWTIPSRYSDSVELHPTVLCTVEVSQIMQFRRRGMGTGEGFKLLSLQSWMYIWLTSMLIQISVRPTSQARSCDGCHAVSGTHRGPSRLVCRTGYDCVTYMSSWNCVIYLIIVSLYVCKQSWNEVSVVGL